jgi:hypothetical protein
MPAMLLKYAKPLNIPTGSGEQAVIAESARIKIDDEKLQAELIQELQRNGSPCFTESEPAFGVGVSSIQSDIKKNDSGFFSIYINKRFPNKESWEDENSLVVVRKFLVKHSLSLQIVKDTSDKVNAVFSKILDEASFPKMTAVVSATSMSKNSLAKGSALFALAAVDSTAEASVSIMKKTL